MLLLTRNSPIVIDKALRFDVSFVKKEEKTSIRKKGRKDKHTFIRDVRTLYFVVVDKSPKKI